MRTLDHTAPLGRRLVLTLAGTAALSGCFGSFGAVNALWKWNDEEFGSKWIKWLVFLGLSIIPVYELFLIGDVLVLNSVEFWTGSNPIKSGADGRTVTRVATANPHLLQLEVRRDGRLEFTAFCWRRADGSLEMLDARGRTLTRVRELGDGSVELRSGDDSLLAQLDHRAATRASELVAQGQPAHQIVQQALGERGLQLARDTGSAERLLF